jgi:hypothetical protein
MSTTYTDRVEIRSGEEPVDYAAADYAVADDVVVSRPGLADRLPTLPALSPVPTYFGIAIAVIGFGLIAYAWGKVAGIADNVALQMPYLVSGGLTGLGLVMVGVTIVNVAAKRRDAQQRQQQTQLLADALTELRNALER